MRKIEVDIIRAIKENRNLSKGNTIVLDDKILLHNNLIALNSIPDCGASIRPGLYISNAGWTSRTTKSRLNALIREFSIDFRCIYQKNYEWFIMKNNSESIPFPDNTLVRIADHIE